MHRNMIEAVLGAIVLALAAAFFWFAYSMADLKASGGYPVHARFDRVGTLKSGSDVRIGGIKVGTVSGLSLDPKNYRALVTLTIENQISLPQDTVAEISSEGLLGGQFLSLVPGNEDAAIQPDGMIKYTQSPVDLVQLLGRFIFSGAEKSGDGEPASIPN